MTTPVALLRAQGAPLVVDGAITVAESYPGEVTDDPLPDRTYATEGFSVRPSRFNITAVVSPNPSIDGLTTGPARIQEVRAWLQQVRLSAEVVDVQRQDRALAVGYLIKSYDYTISNSDSERLTIELVELRVASAETITLATRRAAPEPTDEAKPGTEPEGDKGTLSTRSKSFFADALDYLTGGE